MNFASTIRSTELDVKQLANRPAHLPRVQAPVHMNMLDGAPGVHHKRRPQGMTKITQKYTELLLNWTEQALNGVILHVCEQLWKHMVTNFNKNWQFLHRNAARLVIKLLKIL